MKSYGWYIFSLSAGAYVIHLKSCSRFWDEIKKMQTLLKCDYLGKNISNIIPPVFLHSIFEISSVTRIFFNFKISSLKNWKINLISKLIFAGYTGSRNQVQTRKKIKLVLNLIFFQVWNKLWNPKFENRVQRDRAYDL